MLSFELLVDRSASDANISSTTTTASEWLSRDKRQYCNVTDGILPYVGLYKVCLAASVDHRAVNHSTRVCSTVWINGASDSSLAHSGNQQLVVMVSSVFGGLALFITIVAVIFCCRRSTGTRQTVSKQTSSNQVTWFATTTDEEATAAVKINESEKRSSADERVFRESCYFDKPHIRRESKRYVRSLGRRQPSSAAGICHVRNFDTLTVHGNGDGQPSNGDSFVLSAEDRARILSMLTAATQMHAPGLHNGSGDVDSCRPRRRSTGSPEVQPFGTSCSNSAFDGARCVDSNISAPEFHIYEDIPSEA